MTRKRIAAIFKKYRNSGAWAARKTGLDKSTISHWLAGRKSSPTLDAAMPELASELLRTNGGCMFDRGQK